MLVHDRATTAGSVLGVVAIVFLVGQQLGIMFGLFTLMSVLVDHAGADIWVTGKGTNNANAPGSIPVRYVDRIAGLPQVERADPVVLGGGTIKRRDGKAEGVLVVGLPAPRFPGGPWRFQAGAAEALFDYDGVTFDALDNADLGGVAVGDIFEINGARVRAAALTRGIRGFGGPLVFTSYTKARALLATPRDRCSYILVKLKPAADADAAVEDLQALVPRAEVLTARELSHKTRAYYIINTGMGTSFAFTTLMSAVVGLVIIMLTMYSNVLTREKDFAVLRALGARRRDIFVIVVYQTMMIAAAGIVAGFLLLALFLVGTRGSSLPTYFFWWFAPGHALITILLCFIGSLVAIRRAVRVEPASVFR